MQTVSAAWKAAHEELLLPETVLQITCKIAEPGIEEDATVTAEPMEDFSDISRLQYVNIGQASKYATLEWNMHGLDGTFDYFTEDQPGTGYVSGSLSGEDCVFGEIPTIEIGFSRVHTPEMGGVSLVWNDGFDEWARRFRVTVYNGGTVVAQETVEDSTAVNLLVWFNYSNYDRIVLEILEWSHPYHRARNMSFFPGLNRTYTKSDLTNYKHSQSVDLLSAALPSNEVQFSLTNLNNEWNPDNPTGIERYLQERQKITVNYGLRIDDAVEWVTGGVFWLAEWSTPANGIEVTFTGRNFCEFANMAYTGTKSGTLYAIASAAASQLTAIDASITWNISETLKDYSSDFTETQNEFTVADVLQLVANAGCCVIWQDRAGMVHLEPRSEESTDYAITLFRSYSYPEYEFMKPLKAVEVSYGDDQKVTDTAAAVGETQTVSNDLITNQTTAAAVAAATKELLLNRKTESGEFRADPRLDALDTVTVESKFAENTVVITDITYSTTGGALRGEYVGRVIDNG